MHSQTPAMSFDAQTTGKRAALYDLLDRYLSALRSKAPERVPWTEGARITENNVALRIGDGLWGSITGLGNYQLRFADCRTGNIAFHGVLVETDMRSPFAMRLKSEDGRVAEVEAIVARPLDCGVPFTTGELSDRPSFQQIVPAQLRCSRERMIELANGYFDTLQRNDGTLHTRFHAECNRRENGMQTTNNPQAATQYGFIMGLGCAEQFKLGHFRYDDRLRSRRTLVVDEERGLIMMAAFIDHAGRLNEYTLTDGRRMKSKYRPHTFALLETFKIRSDLIADIEAVFTGAPYRMPSPWVEAGFVYE